VRPILSRSLVSVGVNIDGKLFEDQKHYSGNVNNRTNARISPMLATYWGNP
jgi:hypothetical protein